MDRAAAEPGSEDVPVTVPGPVESLGMARVFAGADLPEVVDEAAAAVSCRSCSATRDCSKLRAAAFAASRSSRPWLLLLLLTGLILLLCLGLWLGL